MTTDNSFQKHFGMPFSPSFWEGYWYLLNWGKVALFLVKFEMSLKCDFQWCEKDTFCNPLFVPLTKERKLFMHMERWHSILFVVNELFPLKFGKQHIFCPFSDCRPIAEFLYMLPFLKCILVCKLYTDCWIVVLFKLVKWQQGSSLTHYWQT